MSGAAKAFARNDHEHAWFCQGFSLIAVYRPLANPGEDLTISVDPTAGIHLEDLWRALERLEDRRWGDKRPRDQPRPLKSYEKKTDNPGPNQPWWDYGGRYTLVAAPRAPRPAPRAPRPAPRALADGRAAGRLGRMSANNCGPVTTRRGRCGSFRRWAHAIVVGPCTNSRPPAPPPAASTC